MDESDSRLVKDLEELTQRVEALERRLQHLESDGSEARSHMAEKQPAAVDSLTPDGPVTPDLVHTEPDPSRVSQFDPPAPVATRGTARRVPRVPEADAAPGAPAAPKRPQPAPGVAPIATIAWIGRTLIVLGGAFLLRAITESEVLTRGVGTVVGYAYGILWLLFADRDAQRNRWGSANFFALTTAIIAFPLVWEAAVRFEILSPVAASGALLFLAAVALAVAWRGHNGVVAWIFGLGIVFTDFGLAFATRSFFSFFSGLLLLAATLLWLGYGRPWRALARTVAVFADIAVLLVTATLFLGDPERAPVVGSPGLLTLQLSLMLIYLFTFALRALLASREVGAFAILQSFAVLAIGFGGASVTSSRISNGALFLAILSLGLAAAAYAVVFSIVDRQGGSRRNFIFYSTVSLFLTLAGCSVLPTELAPVASLGIMALLTAWFGARRARATLSQHGAVYAAAAAIASGLVAGAGAVFVGPWDGASRVLSFASLVVLGVAAVCCGFPVPMHGRTWGRLSRMPRLTYIALLALGFGALAVDQGVRVLPASSAADAAVVGVVRTAVLAAAALLLAAIGRWRGIVEARLLVPPVLVLGGVKLVFEDLRTGRPMTLFPSLVLYGVALILAPRLSRRTSPAGPASD